MSKSIEMSREEALSKMVSPGTPRPGKYRSGVIQIWLTRLCDKACYGCTQGSNLKHLTPDRAHKYSNYMTVDQFEDACLSLKDYWGVVGVFGGNPAMHPKFDQICSVMRRIIPYEQRGIWCNNPLGWGREMSKTFNPRVSNLNVHLDKTSYEEFKRTWPESMPFGLDDDSRHSPPYVAMKDLKELGPVSGDPQEQVDSRERKRWALIADCDINKHWSAMIGVFRGKLRAWFCEVAGAQSMLHQYEDDYPDTGYDPTVLYEGIGIDRELHTNLSWWQLSMLSFANQVDKHCHECGVPLRGYGELAQSKDQSSREQVSRTHEMVYRVKGSGGVSGKPRPVELVEELVQLGVGRISKMTDYVGNARK